jgi:acid phosphatase
MLLGLSLLTPLAAEPVTNHFLKGEYGVSNVGVAKNLTREYCRGPLYKEEIQYVVSKAREYLEVRLQDPVDGKPAIVFDIDETLLSNFRYMDEMDFAYQTVPWNAWIDKGVAPPLEAVRELYRFARSKGLAVLLISQRTQRQRIQTENNLRQAGYEDWTELILKEAGSQETASSFKSEHRKRLTMAGYNILVNLGDQDSDLQGGYAESNFKLPNPMYWVP